MRVKIWMSVIVLVLLCGPAEASDFVVRQERYNRENIFVSKPVSVDLRILGVISREDIRSVEEYARWLKDNVRYRRDEAGDVWLSPDETLTKRIGDCEDFAFLNAAVLGVLGYEPKVIAMVGGVRSAGHAVCIFKRGDRYLWFDNDTLKKSNISSIKEFTNHILKAYGYNRFCEMDLEAGNKYILCNPAKR